MSTRLEIASVFGKAYLETDKAFQTLSSEVPSIPSRFDTLDLLNLQSARLELSCGEEWSFSFHFSPLTSVKVSQDSGQWLDAYLIESEHFHGHVAFRGDDWWNENSFSDVKVKTSNFGCKYTMKATEELSIDLALAVAINNSPSIADDVETWLAVDYLLPQKRIN